MFKEDDTYVIHGPPPAQPLPNISFGKLMYDSLLANPNKHPALVDGLTGESLSYPQLLNITCCLAESLRRNGYGRNTIVSISSENNMQYFIPLLSCLYIGAIVAPVNHNYTEGEMLHVLNIGKPKIIFCSATVSQKFIHLKNTKFPCIEKIIIIDSDHEVCGTETMNNFITKSLKGCLPLGKVALEEVDPEKQVALIMCSSGTTGLPKGVMQTHKNLMVRYMHTLDPQYVIVSDAFLGILPFFHVFGLLTNLMALAMGQKVVVIKRFQEEIFLKAIQDHQIKELWIPPPLVVLLAKSPLVEKYDLSSITGVTIGAAPLGKDIEESLKTRLNIHTVRQGYGLSEATFAVTIMEIGDIKRGSAGKVVTYMSCKIRDPKTGRSLGPGKVGEICVKGPLVMAGYYGNEEATCNTFTSDGWLLTGDLGYYDEEKYFYIVDRIKELIKYKAFQVAPAELEAVILSHPKVKDVGVVGLPDEVAGELPLAFVVKKDNVDLTEDEIKNLVAEKLSSQKKLRGGVIFLKEIPKTLSGKILRRDLKELATKCKSKL